MKVWVADELGQIKTCSFEQGDDGVPVPDIMPVSANEDHNRSDYVQIMAHANWTASGQSKVSFFFFVLIY